MISEIYNSVIADIKFFYDSPKRHYHNWKHIEDGLQEVVICPKLVRIHSLTWAWLFHDIVYDPLNNDNEEKSALFVSKYIKKTSLITAHHNKKLLIHDVMQLIRCTKNHIPLKNPQLIQESQYLIDIDLSILGKDPINFKTYEENIRKEYNFYTDEIYISKRTDRLLMFLNQASIYYTPEFIKKYEKKARKNINELLASWKIKYGNTV